MPLRDLDMVSNWYIELFVSFSFLPLKAEASFYLTSSTDCNSYQHIYCKNVCAVVC